MNITLNNDCNKLIIADEHIADFIEHPSNYEGATISTDINCCSNSTECNITIEHLHTYCVDLSLSDYYFTIDEIMVDNGNGTPINILSTPFSFLGNVSCNNTDYSPVLTAIVNGYAVTFNQTVIAYTNYDIVNNRCYVCVKAENPQEQINTPISIHGISKEGLQFIRYFIENTIITYSDCVSENPEDKTWELSSEGLYSLDIFQDGVYTITITIHPVSGEDIVIKNCYTILCEHKCIIASKIKELKELNPDKAIKLYLIYTALLNGNNCKCDCSKLCEMYEYLLTLLGEINNFNCDEC